MQIRDTCSVYALWVHTWRIVSFGARCAGYTTRLLRECRAREIHIICAGSTGRSSRRIPRKVRTYHAFVVRVTCAHPTQMYSIRTKGCYFWPRLYVVTFTMKEPFTCCNKKRSFPCEGSWKMFLPTAQCGVVARVIMELCVHKKSQVRSPKSRWHPGYMNDKSNGT
jgi:hypothetical protein